MDWSALIGPAVVAAVVSGIVATIGFLLNRSTTIKVHEQKLEADANLAERKFDFDKQLAERKVALDARLADRKHHQGLAEEVLSGFYQVADAVRSIRSPMSYSSEAKDRPRPDGESEEVGRQRDTYYAIISRFNANRKDIGDLFSKRYRMAAWFGQDADAPFQLLNEAISSIITSAQLLIEWSGNLERGVAQTNPDLWHKMEANIWWGAADPDPVATKIQAATEAMEAICRPILEGGAE